LPSVFLKHGSDNLVPESPLKTDALFLALNAQTSFLQLKIQNGSVGQSGACDDVETDF
jgi:hypothetical protein